MNSAELVISDYYELLNLHKALLEAKFHDNPDNYYVAGSPYVARLSSKVIDLLAIIEIERKGTESWTDWRKLSNQDHYKTRAVNAIIHRGVWEQLSDCEKRETVFNYISPFTCTDVEMASLIREIDGLFGNKEQING